MFQELDDAIREMMQDMMTNGFTREQREGLYIFMMEYETKLQVRREVISDTFQARFETDLPQDAVRIIDETTNLNTLRQWSKAAVTASTPEAFLQTLNPDAAPQPSESREPKAPEA